MKRYIRSNKVNTEWEKDSKNTYYSDSYYLYNVGDPEDAPLCHVTRRKGDKRWTISTDNYVAYADTLREAKSYAPKLIEQEARYIIDSMQKGLESERGIRHATETNPYLRYMGIQI